MKKSVVWLGRLTVLSLLINLVIEILNRKSLAGTAAFVVGSPLVFLLNTILVLCPFVLVFATRKKFFAAALLTIFWLGAGVINSVLLIFRTTPFTAADFRLVKYAANLLTTYLTWPQIAAAGAGILVSIVVCMILWRNSPIDEEKNLYQSGGAVILLIAALTIVSLRLAVGGGIVAKQFGNIGQAYKDYGFAYCFTSSLLNTGIEKPEDYGSETVTMIEEEALVPEGRYPLAEYSRPNIIMVQLESFFDPSLWKQNPLETDPIPFFRYLSQEYPSGFLSVPSVGAGTANTEFECITGMNLDFFGPGEYPYKTVLQKTACESLAYDLKTIGYRAHAIHNNEATFYDRHKVFSQLGFDTFTPIEYMYEIERNPTGWCKDSILVEEIEKALNTTEGPDFVYTISVQGHGAYPDFTYYGSQIHEMDGFIKKLVMQMNKREEPVVVVFYGDHLPGFSWTEQDMANGSLFQTPYVIWNNVGLKKENKDVEAYQLGAHVLNQLGLHEGTMIRFHQKYLDSGIQETEEYLEDMQVLEYDMLYGEREIYGRQMPYEPTELLMGVTLIRQELVVESDTNLLVFGENFNKYSTICVDGKALETMYVWPTLLIAKNVPERKRKADQVEVWQIGRDKIPLGKADKIIFDQKDPVS